MPEWLLLIRAQRLLVALHLYRRAVEQHAHAIAAIGNGMPPENPRNGRSRIAQGRLEPDPAPERGYSVIADVRIGPAWRPQRGGVCAHRIPGEDLARGLVLQHVDEIGEPLPDG